jgi:hypothetical protein
MEALSSCRTSLEYLDVPYLSVLDLLYHSELSLSGCYDLQKVTTYGHDVEQCHALLAYMLIDDRMYAGYVLVDTLWRNRNFRFPNCHVFHALADRSAEFESKNTAFCLDQRRTCLFAVGSISLLLCSDGAPEKITTHVGLSCSNFAIRDIA